MLLTIIIAYQFTARNGKWHPGTGRTYKIEGQSAAENMWCGRSVRVVRTMKLTPSKNLPQHQLGIVHVGATSPMESAHRSDTIIRMTNISH
jgi:hypothetical protein